MTMFGARLAGALRLLCLVAAKENQVRPNLTHFALHVANIDATSAFYERFAGMRTVRSWADQDGSSLNVNWLKSAEASNPFVLVLLEGTSETFGGGHQGLIGPLSHFGFAVDSRAEVDDVANKAQAAGVLLMTPRYSGETVGYHCYLKDPDGHSVEFSFGQALE
jgi:catechol 2,3-dioxygenase-like lactoylglutathione lyase family enzyme